MSEYLGSFSRPTLSSTLLVILFIPAFASLAQLVLGSRLPPRVSRALTAVVLASTLGAVLIHVVVLARLPVAERSLMQHAWRMVRVGQLDAGVDLCFDPLSAVMSLIVTSVGVIVSVVAFFDQSSKAAPADPLASHGGRSDPRRRSGWLELIILMMLVVVLADNLVLLLVGWEGMAVAAWGLLSPPRGERFGLRGLVIHRAGAVALLAGVVTLYWGLGGAFEGTGYSPDLSPRFVAVRAAPERAAADAEEAGALTLTSYPGSTVYLDDARTPLAVSGVTDAALRAPFVRARVPLGPHSFRIHPGNSLDDYVVRLVSFAAGDDVVLTLLGPTVTFRQIEAQLELENVFGDRTHDEALRMRKLGGAGLVTVVCLLFTFAAFAKSAQFPMHTWLLDAASQDEGFSSVDGAAILCAATSLPAGVYLVARLAPIFATSMPASHVLIALGATTVLAAGAFGCAQRDLRKVLACVSASQIGMAFVSLGVGAFGAAILQLVAHAFAATCLSLATRSIGRRAGSARLRDLGGLRETMPGVATAYFVACVALTGAPVPFASATWVTWPTLSDALVSRSGGDAFGAAVIIACLAGGLVTSFALWRSYYLVFEGKPRRAAADGAHETREPPRNGAPFVGLLVGLAAAGSLTGCVLGFDKGLFLGGRGGGLIAGWLEPVSRHAVTAFASSSPPTSWAILLVTTGALGAGWAMARERYGKTRGALWAMRDETRAAFPILERSLAVDTMADALVVRPTLRLAQIASDMDRWVIDGMIHAMAIAARVVAWTVARADVLVLATPVDRAARVVARGRAGLWFPESAAKTAFYVLLALSSLSLTFYILLFRT